MSEEASTIKDRVFRELEARGLLLLVDSTLPSVAGLIAGKPIKGSWWGHPKGNEIFQIANQLEDHPDVALVKLFFGKVTFIHRRFWPALLAIGSSREPWQMSALSPLAKTLLGRVEQAGEIEVEPLQKSDQANSREAGEAVRELESRLLVYSQQFHTESGAHSKRIESWMHWARRMQLGPGQLEQSEAKSLIERAAMTYGTVIGENSLPWRKTEKARRRSIMSKKAMALLVGIIVLRGIWGSFVLAEETKPEGNEVMQIGHIHVGVRDLSSALQWFDNVLQWKPTYQDQRIGIVSSTPISVILDASKDDAPATIAFASRDVDADYKRLIGRGAVSLEGPTDKPYGVRAAYLKGPGALKIELEGPLKNIEKANSAEPAATKK